jgi:acetyl esterase/lipase
MRFRLVAAVLLTGWVAAPLLEFGLAAEAPESTRKEDIVYGRKFGTALTMDVLTPSNPNGVGIVWVISGGWYSSHEAISPAFVSELLSRGYTVFAVVHGSQPKFTIPEILDDMHRSVRYIRHHAAEYGIDPERIGIIGGSAGGHLSLMQGLAGDEGDPKAKDPVDHESSRVRAVACFFPPTDFLNYGQTGVVALGTGKLAAFRAPFDFHDLDGASRSFVPVTDHAKRLEIGKEISPITHVSSDDPPTLIIHGDADQLVPFQQSQILIEKLKKLGVPCELVRKQNADHGWRDLVNDMPVIADWFDQHLTDKK